ncbi:MAG: HEPN domain-containing protein [bacterium]
MKSETKIWLKYSQENLESAKILLQSKLFNPCLQNVQQSVEKSLKALLIEYSIKLKKTHSITELKNILLENGLQIDISEEDCEFLDSIYLPSKYPLGGVLPYYEPDLDLCNKGVSMAENVLELVNNLLNK